jgi:uncharacterized surface protein with fasciclin (FAS1) repeats
MAPWPWPVVAVGAVWPVLAGPTAAKAVEGEMVKIDASNGVMINKSKVVKADIETSNGVIHVIDTVLMPQ